jgi:methylglutaconyl-CoA hydratase
MNPMNEQPTSNGDELSAIKDGAVYRITMRRTERRNALSRSLVNALLGAFQTATNDREIRVVLLEGDGPVFCAGGDISEYVDAARTGTAAATADGLTDLLAAITTCPAPVVAKVQGAAYGGGVGLVCAADLAVASMDARFSLSEARLGLVPATISPYVIAALGSRQAKARMLLASPFSSDEAHRIGLVHSVTEPEALDDAVDELIDQLLRSAPGALTLIKRLPAMLAGADSDSVRTITAELLIERLASDEGQEGLRAFLAKRPPAWAPNQRQQASS